MEHTAMKLVRGVFIATSAAATDIPEFVKVALLIDMAITVIKNATIVQMVYAIRVQVYVEVNVRQDFGGRIVNKFAQKDV